MKIETKSQLEERIKMLEGKINIKDDTDNKLFFFDTKIDGKRYKTMSRYNKVNTSKDEAFQNINDKKQKLIKELIVYFE